MLSSDPTTMRDLSNNFITNKPCISRIAPDKRVSDKSDFTNLTSYPTFAGLNALSNAVFNSGNDDLFIIVFIKCYAQLPPSVAVPVPVAVPDWIHCVSNNVNDPPK